MSVNNIVIDQALNQTLIKRNTSTFTIDGYVILNGDSILITGQTILSQNGIYEVTYTTDCIFNRRFDFNTVDTMKSNRVITVQYGNINANTIWLSSSNVNNIGLDAVSFVKTNITPTNLTSAKNDTSLTINSSTGTSTTIDLQSIVNNGLNKITNDVDVGDEFVLTKDTITKNAVFKQIPQPNLTSSITTEVGSTDITLTPIVGSITGTPSTLDIQSIVNNGLNKITSAITIGDEFVLTKDTITKNAVFKQIPQPDLTPSITTEVGPTDITLTPIVGSITGTPSTLDIESIVNNGLNKITSAITIGDEFVLTKDTITKNAVFKQIPQPDLTPVLTTELGPTDIILTPIVGSITGTPSTLDIQSIVNNGLNKITSAITIGDEFVLTKDTITKNAVFKQVPQPNLTSSITTEVGPTDITLTPIVGSITGTPSTLDIESIVNNGLDIIASDASVINGYV